MRFLRRLYNGRSIKIFTVSPRFESDSGREYCAGAEPWPDVGIAHAKEQARDRKVKYVRGMHENVIDISTEVFHLLQRRAPGYVAWAEEKPGPTQKIVVEDDVYSEFVDRAISHRQTLDEVVREICSRLKGPVADDGHVPIGHIKHVHGLN